MWKLMRKLLTMKNLFQINFWCFYAFLLGSSSSFIKNIQNKLRLELKSLEDKTLQKQISEDKLNIMKPKSFDFKTF